MKLLIKGLGLFFILFMYTNLSAQEKAINKTTFLRVYNSDSEKIAKGRLVEFTENTIKLKRGKKVLEINYKDISTIKTKKSVGNNVLYGTAAGGTFFALLGSKGDDSGYIQYSKGTGAGIGFLVGGSLGASAGALSALLKKSVIIGLGV